MTAVMTVEVWQVLMMMKILVSIWYTVNNIHVHRWPTSTDEGCRMAMKNE